MKAVLANQAVAKLYGFNSAEEGVGMNQLDFVHPEDRDRVSVIVEEDMFEKDLHRVVEVRSATKDGREVWISAIGTKTEYQGRSAGLLSIRDITAHKESEAEKQRLEEQLHLSGRLAAVGELSAGIAHELNNPLAAIKGFAQLLIGGDDLDETVKKDLEAICMEAERATKITQDLRSFARRHEPEKRLISINEALAKGLDLCSYQMKVNNIELSVEFDPDLPKTMADFFQMQEVFVNIIVCLYITI
jgi:two-component system NtrC family sensor kinase